MIKSTIYQASAYEIALAVFFGKMRKNIERLLGKWKMKCKQMQAKRVKWKGEKGEREKKIMISR